MTPNAGYPPSYNFPVHVAPDGRHILFHSEGAALKKSFGCWLGGGGGVPRGALGANP